MKVRFERSGGFAGTKLAVSVDSDELPLEGARRLGELVEAAGFFDLDAAPEEAATGADRFRYRVTVETGDRAHSVAVDEASLPPALAPLIGWLEETARRARRS